MSTRKIRGHNEDIYGVEASPSLISAITNAVVDEVSAWQKRPLEPCYPADFMDAKRLSGDTERQTTCGNATRYPHTCFVFVFGHLEYIPKRERAMRRTTTMTVRVSGALSEFVATNVGEDGAYKNVSEYIRDLIRRDEERAQREAFDRLKAELNRAFAAPEDSYKPLNAAEVIARNRT
ncbi:hypothetical protein GCM10011316_38980 [Roseibium aquae]|uniref:Uncharacterized protein n=1 Tax=Roseibium aquae TaxID=1323746 RepID=A0A916X2G3_9HYPH|nr:hypothetical protein GCM10011316_38980 [Roseibium aquae]